MEKSKKGRKGTRGRAGAAAQGHSAPGPQGNSGKLPQGYSAPGPRSHKDTQPLDGYRPGFKFEYQCSRTRITEATMVEGLRTRHRQLGRAFTIKEFNAWRGRPCNGDLCRARFGNWRRAMKAAGIEGVRGRNYSPSELVENLEAAWRKQGRRPGNSTFRLYSPIGSRPYERVWGSLRRACELFAKHKAGQLSRSALLHPTGQPGRPGPRRSKLAPGLRWKVLEAAGHRCCACGRSAKERGVRLEADHIIPVAKGGSDELTNLRALCRECNRGRGAGRGGHPLERG